MSEVQPIRNPSDIKKIEEHLYTYYGQKYADLWAIGLNLGLRVSDLLNLTHEDAIKAVADGYLYVIESKQKKPRRIKINNFCKSRLQSRINASENHTYLFQSESNNLQGRVKPLSRQVVYTALKDAARSVGFDREGTHTMRKTLGYRLYDAGQPIELISKVLNHADKNVTMRYIGLDQDAVDNALSTFEIRI